LPVSGSFGWVCWDRNRPIWRVLAGSSAHLQVLDPDGLYSLNECRWQRWLFGQRLSKSYLLEEV
jgi:hypothetical protein